MRGPLALLLMALCAAACSAMVSSELDQKPSEAELQQAGGGDGGSGGSGGAPVGVLECGAMSCVADQPCCVTATMPLGCDDSCPPDQTEVYCLDVAHCDTGKVCCAYYDPLADQMTSAQCVTTCPQLSVEGAGYVMCTYSNSCAPPRTCQQDPDLPPGYKSCQ